MKETKCVKLIKATQGIIHYTDGSTEIVEGELANQLYVEIERANTDGVKIIRCGENLDVVVGNIVRIQWETETVS